MSGYRVGAGYIGSPNPQTSVANEEIIPSGKTVYKFVFHCESQCHISINGGTPIFINSGSFGMGIEDLWLTSFKIIESGVVFTYFGGVIS